MGPRPAPVVAVEGLVRTHGRARALDGLDLEVGAGEVHGSTGPDGAGRSTTLRALLGPAGPCWAPTALLLAVAVLGHRRRDLG